MTAVAAVMVIAILVPAVTVELLLIVLIVMMVLHISSSRRFLILLILSELPQMIHHQTTWMDALTGNFPRVHVNRVLRAVYPSHPHQFLQSANGQPALALGLELLGPPEAWRQAPQSKTRSWSSTWKTNASPCSCRMRSLWGSCSVTGSSSLP